jgi:hypothetical protein
MLKEIVKYNFFILCEFPYPLPTIALIRQFEVLAPHWGPLGRGSVSIVSTLGLSVCGPNFVNPLAPGALLPFNATMGSSDFQKKNALKLVVKLASSLNIRLTFPGSPKFLTQLIGYMPRSRTPVDR